MAALVAVHWTFRVSSGYELFKHADDITEALLRQEQDAASGLRDSAVSADRGQGIIEVDVTAEGRTQDEATERGHSAVEKAIQSTGGHIRSRPVPTNMTTERLTAV